MFNIEKVMVKNSFFIICDFTRISDGFSKIIPGKDDKKTDGKTRIIDVCGLKVEYVMDRTKWKREIQNYSGDPR